MKVGGDAMPLLLLCPLTVWSLTVTSLPGDTVSLNCSLSGGNFPMLWYRQLPGRPPHTILRTLGAQSSDYLLYTQSGEKFSCKENHTLVIKNVTHKDTAIYYCVDPGQDPLTFNDGIHLTVNYEVNQTAHPFFPSPSESSDELQHRCDGCKALLVSSAILAVLLAVMTPFAVYGAYRLTCKATPPTENIKKNVRSCGSDPKETATELEGDYQMLSHKDRAIYEVCVLQTNTGRT